MTVRAALTNTAAVIEAAVPVTVWDGTLEFTHLRLPRASDQSDVARTRTFTWQLGNELEWEGEQQSTPWATALRMSINVEIEYATGFDAHELQTVIAEDVITLAKALMDSTLFDATTTGIWRRSVGPFMVDLGDDENTTTTVNLNVSIQFGSE